MHLAVAPTRPYRQAAQHPRDRRERETVAVGHHRRGRAAPRSEVGADHQRAGVGREQRVERRRTAPDLLHHRGGRREPQPGEQCGTVAAFEQGEVARDEHDVVHVGALVDQRGAARLHRHGERVLVAARDASGGAPPRGKVGADRPDAHRVAPSVASASLRLRRRTLPDAVRGMASTNTTSSTCL